MAMDAIIMVRASSWVISAPLGGKEGIDILKPIVRPGVAGSKMCGRISMPPSYPMTSWAVLFHREPVGWKIHRMSQRDVLECLAPASAPVHISMYLSI